MISVCMAIYNGEAYIREQLQSILDQTMPADEVILCDDGSTDETAALVTAFIEENKLRKKWRLYRNPQNKGYPANFYSAMSLCRGKYVFLADQDDVWHPRKLEAMTAVMERNGAVRVLSCKYGLIDDAGAEIHGLMSPAKGRGTGKTRHVSIRDVFYKCEWPGMVMAYSTDWYEQKLCSFREKTGGKVPFPFVPHDFLLCAWAAEEDGFRQLDELLAWHRRHGRNTGGEEHRVGRLIDRERKLREMEEYLRILQLFEEQQVMQTNNGQRALLHKKEVMKERYAALSSGKVGRVLRNAWKNRRDTRPATAICDLLIVLTKRK